MDFKPKLTVSTEQKTTTRQLLVCCAMLQSDLTSYYVSFLKLKT
jgi:hypothetical protein